MATAVLNVLVVVMSPLQDTTAKNPTTGCRSAQKASEAAAAEQSQRLRRAAAQEAWLKESFLEAVESEKERLLLARQQQQAASPTKAAPNQLSQVSLLTLVTHNGSIV